MIPFLLPPATRAARRRTVVFLWGGAAAYVAISALGGRGDLAEGAAATAMVFGYAALFRLMHSVRMGQRNAPPLDEREQQILHQAHYRAFQIQGWAMLAVVLYATVAVRMDGLWFPATPRQTVAAFAAVLIALGLLPISILAWTAPEVPHDEDDEEAPTREMRPVLPPQRRNLLVALGVTALAAAGLAASGTVPAAAPHVGLLAGIGSGILVGLVLLALIGARRT